MRDNQRPSTPVIELLKRRRAWIVATVASCVALAALITLLQPPSYEASALMTVDLRATSPSADLNSSLTTGQLLSAHYIKMSTTSTVLDRVCADAGDPCSYNSLKS